ncbi:uncharacterized protein B0J16DRAFT_175612 [Fusarium flagelliforme]|uniref:uncharacterized protein n=1 Tax=Fusarium flagelliforme TaxID=2675880 RepID=UPI001E8E463B|nr:uncharacterized protein B0J16DRAFT_175612 [Fusarium flagelliforme]KAH7179700.1 hypothetical protein B0J16DRAFT_175612 [Fusarium flagelliforme]
MEMKNRLGTGLGLSWTSKIILHRHLYWIKENLWAPMITTMTITYYDIIFFIQFLLAYFHFEEFIPLMLLFMLILSCLYPPSRHH